MPGIGLAERVPLDRSHAGRSPSSDAGWLKRVPQNPRVRYLFGLLLLVALYSGVAQIGYALRFAGPVAAIVWLPVGVGIAFLYFGGLQFWPAVVAGDLLANDYGTLPLGSAFGQTCGNLLEVVVATVLLRRLVPRGDPLGTVSGLGGGHQTRLIADTRPS